MTYMVQIFIEDFKIIGMYLIFLKIQATKPQQLSNSEP